MAVSQEMARRGRWGCSVVSGGVVVGSVWGPVGGNGLMCK